jgi:MFS family permease
MGAAGGLLILGLGAQQTNYTSGSNSKSEEPGGFIGMILSAILFFIRQPLPGKIGIMYGLAFGILMTITTQGGGIGMGIFFSLVFILIFCLLGRLAGFILSKLSRHGNLGALIGTAVAGLALAGLAVINKQSLSWILLFFLFGAVPGLVLGAIIGAIVGAVKKQK